MILFTNEEPVFACCIVKPRENDFTISIITHAVSEDCQPLCRDRSRCGYKYEKQDLTLSCKHYWGKCFRGLQRQADHDFC